VYYKKTGKIKMNKIKVFIIMLLFITATFAINFTGTYVEITDKHTPDLCNVCNLEIKDNTVYLYGLALMKESERLEATNVYNINDNTTLVAGFTHKYKTKDKFIGSGVSYITLVINPTEKKDVIEVSLIYHNTKGKSGYNPKDSIR
jgi:hypothetical protein